MTLRCRAGFFPFASDVAFSLFSRLARFPYTAFNILCFAGSNFVVDLKFIKLAVNWLDFIRVQ